MVNTLHHFHPEPVCLRCRCTYMSRSYDGLPASIGYLSDIKGTAIFASICSPSVINRLWRHKIIPAWLETKITINTIFLHHLYFLHILCLSSFLACLASTFSVRCCHLHRYVCVHKETSASCQLVCVLTTSNNTNNIHPTYIMHHLLSYSHFLIWKKYIGNSKKVRQDVRLGCPFIEQLVSS